MQRHSWLFKEMVNVEALNHAIISSIKTEERQTRPLKTRHVTGSKAKTGDWTESGILTAIYS